MRKGHAPHLQLDSITSAQLAMETLLSLTSKKAGEWFKEELRVLGGLDHIIQTVTQCTTTLTSTNDFTPDDLVLQTWNWDKSRMDALKKVDRCLRVLENVKYAFYYEHLFKNEIARQCCSFLYLTMGFCIWRYLILCIYN